MNDQFPLHCTFCDRWFGHLRAYDRHAVGDGCATVFHLRDIGMIQDSDGVWWMSRP